MKSKTVTYFDLLMVAMSLTMALALPAGAQQVKMAYSGTSTGASAVNLQQPGTVTVEENFEGNGALGPFTVRIISAETTSPQQPPSTCSGPNNIYYFIRVAGAGVFRFQDGSLLKVNVWQGADCIDLEKLPGIGHCTLTLQITGGTGRFKDASGGILTLTETNVPVLADALNNPVFFASTG